MNYQSQMSQKSKPGSRGEFKRNRASQQQQNGLKVEKGDAQSKLNQSNMSRMTTNTNSSKPHLVSHGGVGSGDGLWCVVKEKDYFEPGKYEQIAEKVVTKKTKIVDSKIESLIVEGLEKQCQELGEDLEKANSIARETNIENLQLRKIIDDLNKTINEQMTEIMRLRNSNNTADESLDQVRNKFNELRREHSKLQQDYDEEKSKAETFKQFYEEIKAESEQKIEKLTKKLKQSQQYQDELVEENEDLMNKIQNKQQVHKHETKVREQNYTSLTQKQQMESERKLEKMGKILEENAVLSENLQKSEGLRKKFMEKNQLLDREIRALAQDKLEIEKQLVSVQKRNKDLSVMKSTGTKVLEEKIKDLTKKNGDLDKDNKVLMQKLRIKQLQQQDYNDYQEEDEEELEDVQAKPQLFGAIDTGKY